MVAVAGGRVQDRAPVRAPEAGIGRFTMIESDPDDSIRPEGFKVVRDTARIETGAQREAVTSRTERRETSTQVFLSDALLRDLSEPAYTRKYMD
jgi:hypothetical protein